MQNYKFYIITRFLFYKIRNVKILLQKHKINIQSLPFFLSGNFKTQIFNIYKEYKLSLYNCLCIYYLHILYSICFTVYIASDSNDSLPMNLI